MVFPQLVQPNSGNCPVLCLQIYGFDLEACLEKFNLELWIKDEAYYAFPEQFFNHGFQFPVRSLGLLLGESSPNGFIYLP